MRVLQTTVEDKESGNTIAAVNCYFMSQDGSMFKAQVAFSPYFYLQTKVRPPAKLNMHGIPLWRTEEPESMPQLNTCKSWLG